MDLALVGRVRRGGGVGPDEWRRFASGVDDLDAALDDDGFDDEDDEDLHPIPCDGWCAARAAGATASPTAERA